MKKIYFLLFFNLLSLLSFSQDDGLVSGVYVGVNQASLKTDLFESKGGIGYEIGFLASEYLHTKGDLVYQLSISKYTIDIDGSYMTLLDGELITKNITDNYSRFVVNVGAYYNRYLYLSKNDFFISSLGGLKLSIGDGWERSNEEASMYGVNYGNNVTMETLAGVSYTNIYYGLGLAVGNEHISSFLMYQSSLTNLFRGIDLNENNPGNDTNQNTVRMGLFSLNLVYTF